MANTIKRKELIAKINAMSIKDWNHPDEVKIAMDFLHLLELNNKKYPDIKKNKEPKEEEA